MQPAEKKRWLVLGLLLIATLTATVWVNQNDTSVPQVVDVAKSTRSVALTKNIAAVAVANEMPKLALDKLTRSQQEEDGSEDVEIDGSLFAVRSWYVPPPPPPAPKVQTPVAPPAPVAPPLPFTYMGQVEDGGRLLVYLSKGERAYSVGVGDTIDGTYKVESLDDGQVIFTYLPLSLKQTLKIGS